MDLVLAMNASVMDTFPIQDLTILSYIHGPVISQARRICSLVSCSRSPTLTYTLLSSPTISFHHPFPIGWHHFWGWPLSLVRFTRNKVQERSETPGICWGGCLQRRQGGRRQHREVIFQPMVLSRHMVRGQFHLAGAQRPILSSARNRDNVDPYFASGYSMTLLALSFGHKMMQESEEDHVYGISLSLNHIQLCDLVSVTYLIWTCVLILYAYENLRGLNGFMSWQKGSTWHLEGSQ